MRTPGVGTYWLYL